jgi:hypothetical protein
MPDVSSETVPVMVPVPVMVWAAIRVAIINTIAKANARAAIDLFELNM